MELTQSELMKKIMECQFVCVELNLYIDTHPDDMDAIEDYNCYCHKLRSMIDRYEEQFNPIMNFGQSPMETGSYVCSGWPWER